MSIPICPYCLTRHDFGVPPRCSKHNLEVPIFYAEQYDQIPTLWLATVGFEDHGKSSFIGSLTEVIENLPIIWPKTSSQYLDDYTYKKVIDIRRDMLAGKTPKSTETWSSTRNAPNGNPGGDNFIVQPLLIHTYQVPEFGSQCLVAYDVAGQYFGSPNEIKDEGFLRSLNAVQNIWFFVDLDAMFQEENVLQINQLLQVYLIGMARMGWSLRDRNIIVIYTKADKYIHCRPDEPPYLPEKVSEYYNNDPLMGLLRAKKERIVRKEFQNKPFAMNEYLNEMERISEVLRKYTTEEVPGGQALISLAEEKKLGLEFCIVSSLGTDPSNGTYATQIDPHRVIDPFLWALKMNNGHKQRRINLILDPALLLPGASDDQFGSQFLNDLYDKIQSFDCEVNTYFMSQSRPASIAGQHLPNKPSNSIRCNFIGPILDQRTGSDISLVITSNIIIDLDDYDGTTWEEHLFYVSIAENSIQKWDHSLTLRSADEMSVLINEFKKMI